MTDNINDFMANFKVETAKAFGIPYEILWGDTENPEHTISFNRSMRAEQDRIQKLFDEFNDEWMTRLTRGKPALGQIVDQLKGGV